MADMKRRSSYLPTVSSGPLEERQVEGSNPGLQDPAPRGKQTSHANLARISRLLEILRMEQSIHELAADLDPTHVYYGAIAQYQSALRALSASGPLTKEKSASYEMTWSPATLEDNQSLLDEPAEAGLVAPELRMNAELHNLEEKVYSGEFAAECPTVLKKSFSPFFRPWPKDKLTEPYEL